MTWFLVEMAPCFQFVLQLFVCACSVWFLCVLFILFVRYFEITTGSSNIWITLKGSTPSSTVWKGAIFLKISSFRTPAHIVCRWFSCSPRFVSTDVCQCFQHFDFTPTCSDCTRELWVRGATCCALCFKNESHISHKSWCFQSQGDFSYFKEKMEGEELIRAHMHSDTVGQGDDMESSE